MTHTSKPLSIHTQVLSRVREHIKIYQQTDERFHYPFRLLSNIRGKSYAQIKRPYYNPESSQFASCKL